MHELSLAIILEYMEQFGIMRYLQWLIIASIGLYIWERVRDLR